MFVQSTSVRSSTSVVLQKSSALAISISDGICDHYSELRPTRQAVPGSAVGPYPPSCASARRRRVPSSARNLPMLPHCWYQPCRPCLAADTLPTLSSCVFQSNRAVGELLKQICTDRPRMLSRTIRRHATSQALPVAAGPADASHGILFGASSKPLALRVDVSDDRSSEEALAAQTTDAPVVSRGGAFSANRAFGH